MADYLIDTNVLIRLEDSSSPDHLIVVNAITKLRIQQHSMFVTPQNLIEFYAVATRPVQSNGLGWSVADTVRICKGITSRFQLAPADPRIYTEWLLLCDQHGIQGKRTHDVHLVAAMITHGIPNLLTFNVTDFHGFTSIIAVDPATV